MLFFLTNCLSRILFIVLTWSHKSWHPWLIPDLTKTFLIFHHWVLYLYEFSKYMFFMMHECVYVFPYNPGLLNVLASICVAFKYIFSYIFKSYGCWKKKCFQIDEWGNCNVIERMLCYCEADILNIIFVHLETCFEWRKK